MAFWALEFLPEAEKDLAKIDRSVRRRVIQKLEWFTGHFDDISPINLTGEYQDFYKLRVGDWRMFYKTN